MNENLEEKRALFQKAAGLLGYHPEVDPALFTEVLTESDAMNQALTSTAQPSPLSPNGSTPTPRPPSS